MKIFHLWNRNRECQHTKNEIKNSKSFDWQTAIQSGTCDRIKFANYWNNDHMYIWPLYISLNPVRLKFDLNQKYSKSCSLLFDYHYAISNRISRTKCHKIEKQDFQSTTHRYAFWETSNWFHNIYSFENNTEIPRKYVWQIYYRFMSSQPA